MTRSVLIVTAAAEAAGILLPLPSLHPEYGPRALYYSVFHSISSFCNAGFDVFGLGNSLVSYAYDPLVTITIMSLITVGGLGFLWWWSFYRKTLLGHKYHLKLHTKIVLITSGVLVLAGFLFFSGLRVE